MPNLDRIFFEIDDIQKQSEINSRKKYLVDKYKTLSFEDKEKMAIARIQEFFKYCKLNKLPDPVISFSGGKDSCVLRHMVRKIKKILHVLFLLNFLTQIMQKLFVMKKIKKYLKL